MEASAKFKISSKKKSYCEATISLTILEASAIDSGQYRLKCYNEVNEITTETALIVKREYEVCCECKREFAFISLVYSYFGGFFLT